MAVEPPGLASTHGSLVKVESFCCQKKKRKRETNREKKKTSTCIRWERVYFWDPKVLKSEKKKKKLNSPPRPKGHAHLLRVGKINPHLAGGALVLVWPFGLLPPPPCVWLSAR